MSTKPDFSLCVAPPDRQTSVCTLRADSPAEYSVLYTLHSAAVLPTSGIMRGVPTVPQGTAMPLAAGSYRPTPTYGAPPTARRDHGLRNVSLELRNVSLDLRNGSLELRNVSLDLRNVKTATAKTTAATYTEGKPRYILALW